MSAANMQKDTCQKIIEHTFVVALNRKAIRLGTSLDSNWKELDSTQHKQLLEFTKENMRPDTECSDYTHLIRGEEANGTELPIFIRKNNSGITEARLGK